MCMSNYFTLAEFEPTIPASKQQQTLDHVATGIGSHEFMPYKSTWFKIQVKILILTDLIQLHIAATQSYLEVVHNHTHTHTHI